MIDFKLIEHLLARMTKDSKLFKLVKAEMIKRGHWKNKSRGKAFKKGEDERRKK